MPALDLQSLEVRWQKTKGTFNTICGEEQARRERVRICLLEAEKVDLEDQISDDARRINELETAADELHISLDAAEADVDALDTELNSKNREIDGLNTELTSLQHVSANSQQILSENLALSRELANLKPEIEHLRAQQTSYQALVAEKLELQRKLAGVELELDNERKGNKRIQSQESTRQAQEEELQAQLDAAKQELSKEKRQRQKLEKDVSKAQAEVDGHNTAQESRIEALRTKLKVAREELRKTQSQLEDARSSAVASTVAANAKAKGRKRDFSEISELEFDTPGAVVDKKPKRGSTQIGEKSTFSMTPFLKKTGSVAPDSPPSSPTQRQGDVEAEDEVNVTEDEAQGPDAAEARKSDLKPAKPRGRPPKAVTQQEQSESKRPAAVRKRSAKATELEDLDEIEEDARQDETNDVVKEPSKAPAFKMKKPQLSDPDDMSFIKKKRKILGGGLAKTIFDDDGSSAPAGRGAVKSRPLGALGNIRLGAGAAGRGKPLGGFGGFSPLKKDRKVAV